MVTSSRNVLSQSLSARLCRLLPQGRKNDMAYFTILLRYIHQNPVKAGIAERVKDYEYSSWCEFDGTVEPVFQICDVNTVLNRIPFSDLEEPTNEARADECSLSICLARRRKTIVNG